MSVSGKLVVVSNHVDAIPIVAIFYPRGDETIYFKR